MYSSMAKVAWTKLCENRRHQINALEQEVSRLEPTMSKEEAQMYLDHSAALYDQLAAVESQLLHAADGLAYFHQILNDNNSYCHKVLELKKKLAQIMSKSLSTQVTIPAPSLESKLQSRIKKQKFHIEQIESFKIKDDVRPVDAQVLYDQVAKLHEWFVSNQTKIYAQIDDVALAHQQSIIASQVQHKVFDIQFRLRQIMIQGTSSDIQSDTRLKKQKANSSSVNSYQTVGNPLNLSNDANANLARLSQYAPNTVFSNTSLMQLAAYSGRPN